MGSQRQTRLSDFHFQRSKANTLRSCSEEVVIWIRTYGVLTHLCGFSRTCSLSETLRGMAQVLFRKLMACQQRRMGGEKAGPLGISGGQLCPALRQLDKTEQDKTIRASRGPSSGLSLRSALHASLTTQRLTQGGTLGQGADWSEPRPADKAARVSAQPLMSQLSIKKALPSLLY